MTHYTNFQYLTRVKTWLLSFKTWLITRYSPRYSPRYSTQGRVTRPRFFNSAIWLRLDLGYKALIFALTTNLESGPRFADICCTGRIWKMDFYYYIIQSLNNRHLTVIQVRKYYLDLNIRNRTSPFFRLPMHKEDLNTSQSWIQFLHCAVFRFLPSNE